MSQIRNKQIKFDSDLSFTSLKKIMNLANGTSTNDAVNYGQLSAVQSLIENFEWQNSVLTSTVLDPTAETPTAGDRYLINGTGATGFAGHDNEIATYVSGPVTSTGSWTFFAATTGTFVGADNLPDQLFLFGGSTWTAKYFEATTASNGLVKVGFDVRIDPTSAFFIEAAGDAVGGILTDTATINFTYNDGANTITADLIAGSIDETYLQGLGVGTAGQVLTSDGAGGFAWASDTDTNSIEKRTINASAVTTGNAQLSVTDVFGSDNPRVDTIPTVFVNGAYVAPALTNSTRTTSDCYFGNTSGTAIALDALAGTENLYWNGTVAGYNLDASDIITVAYTI